MDYFSDKEAVRSYLRKCKQNMYIVFLMMAVIFFIYGGYVFNRYGTKSLVLYILLISVALLAAPFCRGIYKWIRLENRTVIHVRIEDSQVIVNTVSFTLFGFIRMRSIENYFQGPAVTFEPAPMSTPYSQKYFGEIYFLSDGVDQYRVAEKLLIGYPALKASLQQIFPA
jgi:hypothetical protein